MPTPNGKVTYRTKTENSNENEISHAETMDLDGNGIWRVAEASFALGTKVPILSLELQRPHGISAGLALREDMARKLAIMCDVPLNEDAARAFVGTYLTVEFASTFGRPTSVGDPYGEMRIDLTGAN